MEADESFRFTLYWLALEIIAGGKADAIAARLGQAYSASKAFATHFKDGGSFDQIYVQK